MSPLFQIVCIHTSNFGNILRLPSSSLHTIVHKFNYISKHLQLQIVKLKLCAWTRLEHAFPHGANVCSPPHPKLLKGERNLSVSSYKAMCCKCPVMAEGRRDIWQIPLTEWIRQPLATLAHRSLLPGGCGSCWLFTELLCLMLFATSITLLLTKLGNNQLFPSSPFPSSSSSPLPFLEPTNELTHV